MTSLDRATARELATLDLDEATRKLGDLALLSPEGLDQVLDESAALIRDDPAVGIRLAELARDTAAMANAPAAVPRAVYILAQAKAAGGEMADALVLIDAARAGFQALGRTHDALRTNLGRSQALNEMGRHDEALDACREILTGAEGIGGPDSPAMIQLMSAAHQNSGLCLELSGRFEDALDEYASAEFGYRSVGDARALAEVAYDRGLVLLTIGQHADALQALQRAADTFRAGGYRALLVMALANTAEVQLHRGEYQQCLASLAEAAEALANISSPGGEQIRLLVAAGAYLALNLLPEALSTFSEAIEFLQDTDSVIDRARARRGQGLALARIGRIDDAIEALGTASEQFKRSGQSSWLADVLVDQAWLQRTQGEFEAAHHTASEALGVAQPGTAGHVRAQLLLAELQDADGANGTNGVDGAAALDDASRSLALVQAALQSAEDLALAPLVASAHHALGRSFAALGRLEEAEVALRRAVQMVENLRDGLGHELVLTRFLDDKLSPYEDLLAVVVARGESATEALAIGEQAKSRTLSDVVSGLVDRRGPAPLSTSEPLDTDLRALYGELFSGQISPDSDRINVLRQRVRDLEARRDIVRLTAMRDAQPGTVSDSAAEPFTSEPGTIVISYARAADALHAFIIDGSKVEMVANAASVSAVAELLERLRRQWDRFRIGHEVIERHLPQMELSAKAVLHALYEQLIAPVERFLNPSHPTRIVIIPDTSLHEVPFHALWDGTGYLLDRYEIVYAPSFDTMRHLPRRRQGSSVVVGVSDELAPLVEQEVAAVGALLSAATVLSGEQATWLNIEACLAGAALIHLAGHALFRPDNPMYSALKVSDRWVTAADLFGLDLEGATVVLSACETARSQHAQTAEINGFVRAFLGAGAATVIASQWTADDSATAQFMTFFYEQLGWANPVGAVRAAQRQLSTLWPHPYYWAPWIVVGRTDSPSTASA